MLSKKECLAYDRLVKKYQSHIYPLIFFNTINYLKYNVSDKLELLEVGTGNGYFSNQFIKKTNFQVYSIDINEEMISIAKNNFPENAVNYIIDDAHFLNKIAD
ncbi:class I SAM-dependent methyltransferase, partial [Staphylococcus pseudintermedius]|nr:class I SAM-dependent methyltransferase [Staphylococcus pseudintermedius]